MASQINATFKMLLRAFDINGDPSPHDENNPTTLPSYRRGAIESTAKPRLFSRFGASTHASFRRGVSGSFGTPAVGVNTSLCVGSEVNHFMKSVKNWGARCIKHTGPLTSAGSQAMHSEEQLPSAGRRRLGSIAFSSLSLRVQLLLAINLPLIVLVAIVLMYDFRQETAERVREKRISLEEEAKTMLPAIEQMQHHGKARIQDYIDTVCERMQDADSPGHHIVVALPDHVLQAEFHQPASPHLFDAIRRAAHSPSAQAFAGDREIIAGASQVNETTVYVSEDMAQLRRSVWSDLVRRVAGFLFLALVAGGLVNLLLLRLVTKPLERLVGGVRKIAAGKLGVQTDAASSAELKFLGGEINAMSQALAQADKYRAIQMDRAREIQQHVLPTVSDRLGFELSSVFQPADEVGGDYYDVIEMPDDKVLLCVADVSGHGVAAAMLTILLRALLRTAAELHEAPHLILDFVNKRFVESTLPGDFATVILVQLDFRSRRLRYAGAGHEPGLLLSRNGQRRELESTGLILGIEDDAEYDTQSLEFEAGDRLLLFTDGVTETECPNGELFGQAKLVELLEETRPLPPRGVTQQLNQLLVGARQGAAPHDDVTIVLVEMAGRTAETVSVETIA